MKKSLLIGSIFIFIGYLLGNYIFGTKINIFNSRDDNKYYFLLNNNKYLGITKDLEVVEKLQEIYTNEGIYSEIEEKSINSNELINNISKFDILVKSSKNKEDIITIEKVVIANYERVCSKS